MSRFAPRHPGDVADMIREEVLGLVTTHDDQGFITTPLPLLAEVDEAGEVQALIGHFASANPHLARAQAMPRAQVSFFGPHGYISPSMVSKPDWGPTWNYRLAQFEVDILFQPGGEDAAIRALAQALEGDRWQVERMGPRYAQLAAHVVAFRAVVVRSSARFKLGQDESDTSFGEILAALGDVPLARAMRAQRD
ncbi:FMN-binding negative transcriptional regulator [Sphingomonas sp. HITSZ_GF]|uniref:FMN-binding negative transcriptional regulator n=1 Tax=Sphingomonas sp. HITSZ_GF TaxID=3037247 RepID=UPI00240D4D5C|nr:FMN-binding negative transcriptional regulator [Sphingomonas sp. HITSZ_GF]MDG2534156.1 FMN-binding negative transcriptional regulator [Sphingomonas sp. HITSZ_GF]